MPFSHLPFQNLKTEWTGLNVKSLILSIKGSDLLSVSVFLWNNPSASVLAIREA